MALRRPPNWFCFALTATATLLVGGDLSAAPTEPGTLTNPLRVASDCLMCHSFDNSKENALEPLYAPYFGWAGTLMANAARDPIFWAGVAIADQDQPGETVDCIRCHANRAFLDGRGDATAITDLLPDDFDGVTCETCHRMMDDGVTPPGNARYTIDDVVVDGLVPRRGPWDDYVVPDTPPHSWIADPFTGSSELCGTCHDVSTGRPRLDDAGAEIAPNFNEQRTYSEWLNSDYAVAGADFRSCQDCHMPPVENMAACEAFNNFSSHPTGGRRHDLIGANRFMLELLQQEYGSQGSGEVLDFYFDMAMDRMDEFIQTAATLELQGPASVNLAEGLAGLQATVTNTSGHKLPSGYAEGRVMWIEIDARYGDEVVWSSGAFEPGVGPADDGQLRTYEGIAEQLSSGATLHLLLNDHWVEDTRIPPLGLRPDLQTDPVGDRYTLLGDGTWPNYDVAPYDFTPAPDVVDTTPADTSDDELIVAARLWYLINTPSYVEFLANENVTNDAGNDVAMLFDTAGGAPPLLLTEVELAIPIDGFGAVGTTGTDTGVDSTVGLDDTTAASTNPATSNGPTGPSTDSADETAGGSETGAGEADDDGGSCNCSSRGSRGAAWLMLLPLLGLRRRSARAARSRRRA